MTPEERELEASRTLVKAIEKIIPRVGDSVIYLKLDDALADYYRAVKRCS